MGEESDSNSFIKKWLPRLLKALVWGMLHYLLVYFLPMQIFPVGALPLENVTRLFQLFVMIVVVFAVVSKLFSGTVMEYAVNVVKAVVLIGYFLYVFGRGIFSLAMSISETTVNLEVDLTVFLVVLISLNLLALAKNVLQTLQLLAEKAEVYADLPYRRALLRRER